MTSASDFATISRSDRDWRAAAEEMARSFRARAAEHDNADSFVAENYAALKDAKMFSAGVPLELGGGGASYDELAIIVRTLARGCSSTGLAFAMHTHPVALTVWRWRHDKAPVEPLLRRIASEELILVSSGGSDWLQGGGVAERVEGGYRITGTKAFASGSPSGDLLMTSAVYEDPEAGPTVLHFGLPLKAAGVRLADTWRAHGMRGTGSGDVVIEGFFLADAAVGVKRPQGKWHRLFHIISMQAFPIIYSAYLGVAEAARNAVVEGASRRVASADLTQLIGAMETELLAAQVAVDEMVRMGVTAQPGPETTSRVFALKSIATRSMLKSMDHALAASGGAAFRREHPLEALSRDIQGARYHPVSELAQLTLTGREVLGLSLDG
jgi:acyl-CoA dehydrogenase